MEIANELIPHVMKAETASNKSPEDKVLNDPICFGHLIRFYDGICSWEEGSPTPVLHIGWAKPMVASFSKFDADVRAQLKFSVSSKNEDDNDMNQEELDEGNNSSPFCYLNSHENISVDTDDNSSLQNESFQSTSSEEGICLLSSRDENNKNDKLSFLCVGNDNNVPDSIDPKSNNRLEDHGEIAINNNYYEKYSTEKSTSTVCDKKMSVTLNSRFTSSYEIQSVKNKNSITVINKASKDTLPSVGNNVCDNYDHVQIRNTSNHKKQKSFRNHKYSQENYNRSVQKACPNCISVSSNCNLSRCDMNSCDNQSCTNETHLKLNSKHGSKNVEILCNDYDRINEEVVVNVLSGVCGTRLLSVDYLLGHSCEPFVSDNPNQERFSVSELLFTGRHKRKLKPKFTVLISGDTTAKSSPDNFEKMKLQSAKMMGLKELLCSEKMNTSAIQLQLTAQSQTESKKPINFGNNFSTLSDESLYLINSSSSSRPKRSRRE